MMYRSNESRVSTNDPNYITQQTPDIRSLDEVLAIIDGNGAKRTVKDTSKVIVKTKSTNKSTLDPLETSHDQTLAVGGPSGKSYSAVFQVIYGVHKPYRKHKQFTCDGFLAISRTGKHVTLFNINGKRVSDGKGLATIDQYVCGNNLVVGSQELQINDQLSPQEFESGSFFEKLSSDD